MDKRKSEKLKETEEDIKATLEACDRDKGPSEMVEESKNKRKKKKKKNKKNKKKKEEEGECSKSASENKKDETGNNLDIDEQIGYGTSTYFSCDGSPDSSSYFSASALSLSEDDPSLNDDNNATDANQISPLDDPSLNGDNNATDANQISVPLDDPSLNGDNNATDANQLSVPLDDPSLNDDNNATDANQLSLMDVASDNNVNPDERESHHSDHNNLEENDATDAKELSPMDVAASDDNVNPDESESSKPSIIASSTGLAESHHSDHNNLEDNTNAGLSDSAATSVKHNQEYLDMLELEELLAEIKQAVSGTHDDSKSGSKEGHGSSDQSCLNNTLRFSPSAAELGQTPLSPANSPGLQGGKLSPLPREVAMDPNTPYRNACLRGLMAQPSTRPPPRPLPRPLPPIARGR